MQIPEHWAEARVTGRVKGRERVVRRFGWSDDSLEAAQRHAEQRASAAMAELQAGRPVAQREQKLPYGGDGLPIREQVLARNGDLVVTRNSYGSLCLNEPDVLCADIDYQPRLPELVEPPTARPMVSGLPTCGANASSTGRYSSMFARPSSRRNLAITTLVTSILLLLGGAALVQHRAGRSWSAMQQRVAEIERMVASRSHQREPLWGDPTEGLAFAHYERAADVVQAVEKTHSQRLLALLPITKPMAPDADLRNQWRPALVALRAAAHTTDTTMPPGSRLAPPPYGITNLLTLRWLANTATFEARYLLHEGHDVEAVRCSLDAATLGLDVIVHGSLIDQMIGTATLAIAVSPWTDERLAQLSPAALQLLANGLERLDHALPVCLALYSELVATARELAKLPAGDSLASVGSAWRYGFSVRAMVAAAFHDYADFVDELTATESAPWPARHAALDGAIAAGTRSGNPITETLFPCFASAERSLREAVVHVRLLRMAVALHGGDDAPPLPDPLGAGPLLVEPTAEGARLASAGTAERPQLVRVVRR